MADAADAYEPNGAVPDWKKFRHASCMDDNLGSKPECRYTDFIGQGWNQNYTDDMSCSASAKYFAAHNSGSNILVVQLHKPGRKSTAPCAKYHSGKGKVTVSRWSPHNNGLLASGDENGNIMLHFFEDDLFDDATGLLKADIEECMSSIDTGLSKKITSIAWHPVIKNLIAVAGGEADGTFVVKFFDADSGEELLSPIVTKRQAMSLDWSWDSRHLAFCDKTDKGHTCMIYDVKAAGGPAEKAAIKTDLMRTSCLFMNDALDAEDSKTRCNKYVVVIGSSGARSKSHMDIYNYAGEKIGKFNFAGTDKIYATWDAGRNFVWLMIKGSGQMRGVAWKPGKSPTFKVSCNYSEHGKRLKGGCFLPQKGCQVMDYVIAELMGLEGSKNDGEIWPFRFIVPRRKKGEFEAGLYPAVVSVNQDMDAAAWSKAENLPGGPKMTSCNPKEAEDAGKFVKKLTYSELKALCDAYEAIVVAQVQSGAVSKDAIPEFLKAKLAAEAEAEA